MPFPLKESWAAVVARVASDVFSSATERPLRFQFDSGPKDSLFNSNCYHFLKNLQPIPEAVRYCLPAKLLLILQHIFVNAYDKCIAYGNVYKALFDTLDSNILKLSEQREVGVWLDKLFSSDPKPLQRVYQAIQAELSTDGESVSAAVEKRLAMCDPVGNNDYSPSFVGGYCARGTSLFGSEYKPQYTTGLACGRGYRFPLIKEGTEYRLGTQAQRHNNQARLNPFFKAWLNQLPIGKVYLYINNLGLDRDALPGQKEQELSLVLHQEAKKVPGLIVITLPADGGLLDSGELKATESYRLDSCKALMIAILNGECSYKGVADIKISKQTKALLYPKDSEDKTLAGLFDASITSLGLAKRAFISSAERHGLFFHMVKFELTKHILIKLQPKSFNISCKDGIDRAGVASLYLNFIASLKQKRPMTRDEFMMGLHAAPVMVKGRLMNHHLNNLCNVLNMFAAANQPLIESHAPWLNDFLNPKPPSALQP